MSQSQTQEVELTGVEPEVSQLNKPIGDMLAKVRNALAADEPRWVRMNVKIEGQQLVDIQVVDDMHYPLDSRSAKRVNS